MKDYLCIVLHTACGGDDNAIRGCGTYCNQRCSDVGKPPKICPPGCIYNGCKCKDGYFYDSNIKKCVKKEDCTPICGLHEQFSSCINGGCDPRNCSQLGKPVPCIKIDPKYCIKGCVCVKGYLRAKNGTCVPENQCNVNPPICPKNEEYSNCSSCMVRRCSELGYPLNCDKCKPGCICKGGLLRADDGTCIPSGDCPSCGGDDNAEQGCGSYCNQKCSDVGKPPGLCPIGCIYNGCKCKDGYFYDSNIKKCVRPKDCTPTCGINEVLSSCINGYCGHRNCSELGGPILCVDPPPGGCIKGCVCADGYLRADNGTCVPKDQCGCGGDPNAEKGCGYHCGNTCTTYSVIRPICPRIPCKPNGCECKKGFVYDINLKQCVLPKDCTPMCGLHEQFSSCINGGCGHRNCSQIGQPVICIDPIPSACIKGCICVKGYLRDGKGKCVPEKECPSKCGLNEVYDECPAPCPPKKCNVNEALIRCKAPPKPGDPECKPGCRCADNYYRNATGTCVLKKNCEKPLSCPYNEQYDPCPAICPPQECGIDPAVILCMRNPEYGDPRCKPGCVCKDGEVRNDAKQCVPKDKCPKKCGKNEHYEQCYYNCGGNQTCDDIGKKWNCPAKPKCLSGCRCDDGYWRDKNGRCIPEDQCPKKCGKNEHYEQCYYNCVGNQTCDDIGKKWSCPAKPKCLSGCRCDKGYWRDKYGRCIPENQCPKQCGKNEHWDTCYLNCGVGQSCEDIGKNWTCPDQPQCQVGCRCDVGYWRNKKGICIPEKECPIQRCGKNEYWEPCIPDCRNQSCNLLGKPPGSCPGRRVGQCNSGCRCLPKHYRDWTGTCIPESECPTCEQWNEDWVHCIQDCAKQTCEELITGKVNQCPEKPGGICPGGSGCRCRQGAYRNASNICVPREECPKQCGTNEHYEQCYYNCGGNQTCDDIGKKWSCPAKPKCLSGCRCDKGYWRDKYHRCIPENQCPKQCGKNEHWVTCYRNCGVGQSCEDVGKNWTCSDQPQCQFGCRCDIGYWRNKKGICIPEKECPIQRCGKNEYWEPCIQDCRNQSCNLLGKPAGSCPARRVGQCNSGCRCLPKHYRDWTGTCIPESECPRCEQWNEDWVHCIQDCAKQTCEELITGKVNQCPKKPGGICPGGSGCRCRQGAYRNASNICVTKENCPPGKCPPGEVWNWCPAVKCEADYCAKSKDSPTRCPIGIVCDPPRCECEKNKKRDRKTGKCIRIADCPPFPCPHNEEYKVCPPPCPGETCSEYITGPPGGHCPQNKPGYICTPQCRCLKGYSRNDKGTCIPSKNCPNTSITTTAPPTNTSGTRTGDRGSGLSGVLDGITAFTGKCLYDRMQSSPSENIIMSAMSVFTPIAELCLYTEDGPAFDQCIKILNLKDKKDIRDTFANFSSLYEGVTSVNFSTAAKVYSNEKYELSAGFIKDAIEVFHAAAQNLDFSKNVEAAAIMNAWVESQTNNRIKNLVTPDMISALTRLVLINAIYFKGNWLYRFNETNTKEEDFYLSDGSTAKVKLMYQEINDLEYGEVPSLDCKVVRILYTGKESSAIIILPNSINGTMQLAKDLQNTANWKKVIDSLYPQKVKLYLPKFVMSTTTDLKVLLQKANITHWFDCANSGLSGILAKPEDICISAARQKAWCEFSEVGTEAAAANVIVVGTASVGLPPPPTKIFRADHDFLYYILVKDIVAFEGCLVKPSTE
ncbi:zonadhesin-like isoform X2 [Cydia pomonella]|uniref:zonadhesin-like isoform X2 n=1 Tax=Cydia pomonella TaxID=82600 RepID=UPI002ADE3470|nr:zonadhesin-like isoform X2 [Cydia pomonella]